MVEPRRGLIRLGTRRYRNQLNKEGIEPRMDLNIARGVLSSALVDLPPGDEGTLITSVETYALAVPLGKTIADSTASSPAWILPVVEIRTADGRVGTGISGVHGAPEPLCDLTA